MIGRFLRRIRYKRYSRFAENLTGGIDGLSRRALLYYVTEPFWDKRRLVNYEHTFLWEVLEIVRILNHFGFIVDVVDRSSNDFVPEDKYDIFIGLGAGNSGKRFAKYGKALPNAFKVLYATGPDPDLSNTLVKERYDQFRRRTGVNAPYMRVHDQVDFPRFIEVTDIVFCYAEPGTFSFQSYEKHGKPVYSIMPGASPNIRFSTDWLSNRKRNKFMCFAGNGFICKGVDILVEAFLDTPELELHICGPDSEPAFFQVYGEKIDKSPNIHFEGFVKVASEKFNKLVSTCSWVILNSASEGCATSIVTCQRGGLVPVVNFESGVKVKNFGFMMEGRDNRIDDVRRVAKIASQANDEGYKRRVYQALEYAQRYTQPSFTRSFGAAILKSLPLIRL